ncbi:MAG: 4-(cytidine 5'-diphospho)-2-C-methyl-D-erythritol kinase [Dehalococcoidia bacterium]|nr:4-(cytidine 5'-diphospho)-2-C-methyl-D-erythritol kinase [Dehalococcoidia bacterium]
MLTIEAPAKVNLVLEVLGKRNDYHQISSVIQAIDLCDVLALEPCREMFFICDEPLLERDNLVMKAAELLRETTGCCRGAKIDLRKRIPWGMGLGGGSSDAAAALTGLNDLWDLGLPPAELAGLGAGLGADIPFFVHGGMAMVEGKGERVKALPNLPLSWFVLLVPPVSRISEKTKHMYGRLKLRHFTAGQFTGAALSSLRRGKFDLSLAFNAFEGVAFDVFPELGEYQKMFEEAGAPRVCLTGSGPCLFTIVPREREARELCSRLRAQGMESHVASSRPGNSAEPLAVPMPRWR